MARERPAGRVWSRGSQIGGEVELGAGLTGIIRRQGPDIALGVNLLKTEVLGERLVQRVGFLTRALRPLGSAPALADIAIDSPSLRWWYLIGAQFSIVFTFPSW